MWGISFFKVSAACWHAGRRRGGGGTSGGGRYGGPGRSPGGVQGQRPSHETNLKCFTK